MSPCPFSAALITAVIPHLSLMLVDVILIVDFFLVNISKINLSLILILLHPSSNLYSCGRLPINNTDSEILKCTTEVLYICVQDSRSRDSNISTTCVAWKELSSELIAFCSSLLLSESLLYFNFASRGVSETQPSLSACCHHLGRTQKCAGGRSWVHCLKTTLTPGYCEMIKRILY